MYIQNLQGCQIFGEQRTLQNKFWCIHGSRWAKKSIAGYYFHVEPGSSFLSGGIYMAPPEIMRRVREDISDYSDEFLKIIGSGNFKKYFSFHDAEKLKKYQGVLSWAQR
jgi:Conserved hypothetical protein (DUF2461).